MRAHAMYMPRFLSPWSCGSHYGAPLRIVSVSCDLFFFRKDLILYPLHVLRSCQMAMFGVSGQRQVRKYMSDEGLSAYERERNNTIAQNNAKLRELGLDGDLALFPPKHAKQTATTTRKRKAEAAAPAEPTRRSSRSRSQPAANLYVVEEDEKTGRVVLGGSDAQAAKIGAKRVAATHPDELPIGFEDLRPGLERKVWQILREARNAKAKAMERSMFIVCNDRTLCEIVRTVPTEVEQLHDLYGMGEKKVKAHGALLLEALRPHADALKADHEAARAVLDDERPSQGAHLVVD